MEVCFAVHKTINFTICNTVFFFISGGGFDDVLVRLQLIEKCIKDANLMCILFSIKHPQTIVNECVQYVQNYFQYVYLSI